MKQTHYSQLYKQSYFWRTYTEAELDYIEEYDGKLHAYESKWGNKIPKVLKTWVENYKNTTFDYVNRVNFLAFIL